MGVGVHLLDRYATGPWLQQVGWILSHSTCCLEDLVALTATNEASLVSKTLGSALENLKSISQGAFGASRTEQRLDASIPVICTSACNILRRVGSGGRGQGSCHRHERMHPPQASWARGQGSCRFKRDTFGTGPSSCCRLRSPLWLQECTRTTPPAIRLQHPELPG